jgi:dTDP-4-amino-4,6-dideoxygalactose transaminase
MAMNEIPFNIPYINSSCFNYIKEAIEEKILHGDGTFTRKCQKILENITKSYNLITNSGTSALNMAAILADISFGDEVIMPSYTFTSTAISVVMRGGCPVFIDSKIDDINLDVSFLEGAITKKTKAILPMHYAGVACDMDFINDFAKQNNLLVIEDAAQGVGATYKNKALGTLGDIGCYSFHGTKNVVAGEAGALLTNKNDFAQRAQIVREKGTNRSMFLRGEVDKYTWVDFGSSFLASEIIAAFLLAQLEEVDYITNKKVKIWNFYHELFEELEKKEFLSRPNISKYCKHNGHIYYIILKDKVRDKMILFLRELGIQTVGHYVPLHSSPAGIKFGRFVGDMKNTDIIDKNLLRLPNWIGISKEQQIQVFDSIKSFFKNL